MTVRWRILAFELAGLGFILAMALVMALSLRLADGFVKRIDGVHSRFEAMAELDGNANNYAEQLAEVLALGRDRMDELEASRIEMERTFARLTQVTRAEIATVDDKDEIQRELPELEATRRMLELYHAIDMAAAKVLALQREGRTVEARKLFETEVEFRLANEMQTLIDSGLEGERDEVAGKRVEVERTQNIVLLGAGGLALASLTAMAILGSMLRRAIVGPVEKLAKGADALAEGHLEHRIEIAGSDELAALSRVFNRMADALAQQQERVGRSEEQLSSEVEARTQQLQDANARLRDVDGKRAQFLADVSHELRTPLTILRGEAEVALRGRGDVADLRQTLERIQGQSVELGQLLEDLISFARHDAESQQHLPEAQRLDEIIAAAAQEAEVLAGPREISVHMTLADGGTKVFADFRRLKQALIIGLDNAVKHSPPGSQVEIGTMTTNMDVRIAIRDHGTGIAEEDKPRVFERFFRGKREADFPDQGLGIGLSIARQIVERHGGRIGLDNDPEGGAVLEIVLPLPQEAVR